MYGTMAGHDAFDVHGVERDQLVFLQWLSDRLINHALTDLDRNRTDKERDLAIQWIMDDNYDYACSFRSACELAHRNSTVIRRMAVKAYRRKLSISMHTKRPHARKSDCPFPGCDRAKNPNKQYCFYHNNLVKYRKRTYPHNPEIWEMPPHNKASRGRLSLKQLYERSQKC